MTAPTMSGRIGFITCPCADRSGPAGSALARLQFPDVLDDLVDLRIGEGSPNAGIAPGLPFLMRLRMKSSSRLVSISCGPLPASRPPSEWQKPQVVANSCSTSNGALSCAGAAGRCAWAGKTQPNEMASAASGNATMPRFSFITHKSTFKKSHIGPSNTRGAGLRSLPGKRIAGIDYLRL